MASRHPILGKKILFVTAHPDDESYTAAGTILRNKLRGGRSFVFCATFGEKGKAHLAEPVGQNRRKEIRRTELEKVSSFLGVDKLVTPGFPDTKLSLWKKSLFLAIKRIILKFQPEVIISFGPDGISGHLDHIAVGRAAEAAAGQYKRGLFWFAHSPKLKNWNRWIIRRRRNGVYLKKLNYTRPDIRILVPKRKKLEALLLHDSQMPGGDPFWRMPPAAAQEFLSAEYFRSRANFFPGSID